jgi:MinD superfamily P-loop ATPase
MDLSGPAAAKTKTKKGKSGSKMRVVYKWMPVISADRCPWCGLCVEACGPKSLDMVNGIAALTLPDTCGSEEHCVAVCRDEAISMAWLPFVGDTQLGKWTQDLGNRAER